MIWGGGRQKFNARVTLATSKRVQNVEKEKKQTQTPTGNENIYNNNSFLRDNMHTGQTDIIKCYFIVKYRCE